MTKQIERLPAVVLCATLVLPCLTLRPEKFGRAGRVPLARLDAKQTRRAEPPGCASCRAFQRARHVASSSFEVAQGQRHDGEP
jgi:hypothetical protein